MEILQSKASKQKAPDMQGSREIQPRVKGKKSMEAEPEMTRVIELVDKDIKMAIINLLQMIKKVG